VAAWLFIVLGTMGLAAAGAASVFFGMAARAVGASGDESAPLGVAVLGLTGIALTILLVALGVPSLICGVGLLKFRRWARLLGIVLAAIALLHMPLGTLFGLYVLWVLFQKDTERLFGLAE
jgi:hypothetical protein